MKAIISKPLSCALLLTASTALTLSAPSLAYEGFDYVPPGIPLNGLSGGTGFAAGGWAADPGITVQPPGLSSPFGLPSTGLCVGGGFNASRQLAGSLTQLEYWVSFMIQANPGNDMVYLGLDTIPSTPLAISFGRLLNTVFIRQGTTIIAQAPYGWVTGSTYLLVARFQQGGAATRVDLWIDPANLTIPPLPPPNLTVNVPTPAYNLVNLQVQPGFLADEIRLGTSPGDVAAAGPVITNQPQSQIVNCGGTASFDVGATGSPPLSYQWRRNGLDLVGNTIGGLVLRQVDVSMEGIYDVVISNSYGSVTSAPAALSIIDPTPYSLTLAQQGSNVALAWPATCASYVLQESPNLNDPMGWMAVATPPQLTGGSNYVNLALSSALRFYRLISSSARDNVVAGRWFGNGPGLAGRHSGIVAIPGNPNALLISSPGGGVWRTFNGGATWAQPLNYAMGDYSVLHLEWDRVRSGRLYAPTYSDLYATTDLGDHWSNLTHFGGYPAPLMPLDHTSDPRPFAQLRYSPFAADCTVFWSKPCQGLYYSYDGSTFTQTWPFPGGASNPDNCILSIAADESTGYVYFSTMNREPFGPAHLFRSASPWTATTPSLTWVPANTGLPNNALVAAIAYGGSPNVLAVAVDAGSSALVYTTTTGTSWDPALNQPPSPAWDPRVLVSPAANQLLLSTVLGYETHDWGNSWNSFSYVGMHPDVRAFYWGTFQGGNYLWLTTDGSSSSGTYSAVSRFNFNPGSTPVGGVTLPLNGLNTWQCYFMVATGNAGVSGSRRRYFMGSQDNGCLASDDGITWTTGGTPPAACGDYPSMVFAPSNPDRGYARTCDGAAFGRTDNAYSAPSAAAVVWSSITPPTPNYTPTIWTENMIAVDPLNQDHVCFANLFNVAVSSDAGNTWTSHSLPGGASPVCVFFNNNSDLYAGTVDHGVYKSTDNAASWSPFGLNSPAPKIVFGIAHSTAGGGVGTFFLATTRGLYRQLPGGAFTLQTADPSYTVSDVRVDSANPNRVCICMGFASLGGQHRGGVLLSTDNGGTFTSLTAGLDIHQAPIAAVQFDPADSRYIHAAVYGLGGWTCFAP